jgi:hypothetical protein
VASAWVHITTYNLQCHVLFCFLWGERRLFASLVGWFWSFGTGSCSIAHVALKLTWQSRLAWNMILLPLLPDSWHPAMWWFFRIPGILQRPAQSESPASVFRKGSRSWHAVFAEIGVHPCPPNHPFPDSLEGLLLQSPRALPQVTGGVTRMASDPFLTDLYQQPA